MYKFMEAMLEEVKYCKKVMKKEFNKPLRMMKDDEEKFQKAEKCHICNKKYTNKDIRVRGVLLNCGLQTAEPAEPIFFSIFFFFSKEKPKK